MYQQIIDKVIQASQNDFEEFGVDQTTLEEMKQVRDSLVGYPAIAPSHSSSHGCNAQSLRALNALSCLFLFPSNYSSIVALRWTMARCSLALAVMGGRKRG